jgi:hypothetical protein
MWRFSHNAENFKVGLPRRSMHDVTKLDVWGRRYGKVLGSLCCVAPTPFLAASRVLARTVLLAVVGATAPRFI